jgi:peptidoglycan L-alanyl-D-glutamate endopeptidase CwlK
VHRLSDRSWERLRGVNPRLVAVVARACQLSERDFTVLEGLRTRARQADLVKAGASQTMNSRHLTGDAVDLGVLVDGKVSWDFALYRLLAATMQQAAEELGVPLEWGGNWTRLRDGPHFQIPRT